MRTQSEPSWKETVENWKRDRYGRQANFAGIARLLEDSFFAVEVSKDDVEEVIARWTGIPVQSIKQEEATKLLEDRKRTCIDELFRRVMRFRHLARAIRRSRAGLKNPQ